MNVYQGTGTFSGVDFSSNSASNVSRVCVCLYVLICVYVCLCVFMRVYACVFTCLCVFVFVYLCVVGWVDTWVGVLNPNPIPK